MSLGKRISAARKKEGLTQAQLAELCGVATITIQQYERDKREPRNGMVEKIAAILKTSSFELFTGVAQEHKPFVRLGYEVGYEAGGKEWRDYLEKYLGYTFSDTEQKIVDLLEKLNDEGQKKAVERVEELTEIPKYQKEDPQDNPKEETTE